jgi:predicted RNA-binding protein with PUA-like domain
MIGLAIFFVFSRRRPELIEAMGDAFTVAEAGEPDTAQEDVRRREDHNATQEQPRWETIE